MTKLNEVFSKNSGITVSDIDKIETGFLHENHEIEITDIDNYIADRSKPATKKERKTQNRKIVSELISFLNSSRGVGLLFLGFAEINGKIVKKGVKSIKTKEQIRSIIYSNIGSIPSNIKNFKLDVIPIEYNEGNIFIIEVENNDLDCIFYSKIDNLSYERRGDECKSISLPDFLESLARKNHARVFTKFIERKSDENNYFIDINFSNEGNEPGIHILGEIKLFILGDILISLPDKIYDKHDFTYDINDLKNDKNFDKNNTELSVFTSDNVNLTGPKIRKITFYLKSGFPPSSILSYPHLQSHMGQLKIEKKDLKMIITTKIYEKKGQTSQEFYLSSENEKFEIIETNKIFKSYLNF